MHGGDAAWPRALEDGGCPKDGAFTTKDGHPNKRINIVPPDHAKGGPLGRAFPVRRNFYDKAQRWGRGQKGSARPLSADGGR